MKNIEAGLFKTLSSKLNFYIKEYNDQLSNIAKWIAILDKKEFIYAVIVSDEENYESNYNYALKYLENSYNKPIGLNVVIIVKDNLHNINYNLNYNKLIYSLEENMVVYSDESCKPLKDIIEMNYKENVRKKNWFKNNIITCIIILINVILFIITAVKSSNIYGINTYVLIDMGAKVNILINSGQVWRLITCGFLHGGLMHIFFNMYSLKIIGPEVQFVYGKVKYLIIYLVSIIGSSIFSYLFNSNSVSVGASGAIFGLLGAMIIFAYNNRRKIGKNYIKGLIKVVIINMIIGVTLSNIDNSAHLGGLISGIIISYIFLKLKNNAKEEEGFIDEY